MLNTDLKGYFDAINQIKSAYSDTPVGASESIFAMLAPALGLNLLTPSSVLTAISEGTDPTAADKATIDAQIKNKQIKVYVYNSQNATPDVQAQVAAAKAQGIPVATITETLDPPTATFQDYMEYACSGTRMLYASPAIATSHRAVAVHRGIPTPMRAPHEGPGMVALEIVG